MQTENPELNRVCSTAIIHRDGKYLIVRRSPDKGVFPGKWYVPGGGLEKEDYANTPKTTPDAWYYAVENSLKREIKEETELEVGKLNFLLDCIYIQPNGIPVVVLSYWCEYKSGEVKLNEENDDYRWVTFEEVKNYDLIEGILQEIEMTDNKLKGRS